MSKFVGYVKKNLEFISYCFIAILLIFGCFFEVPMLIVTFFIILVAIFFSYEQILSLYLFIFSFVSLFSSTILNNHLYDTVFLGLTGVLAIKYLWDVINKQEKPNFKILIPIAIFSLFLILPIHNICLLSIVTVVAKLVFIYVAYQKRENISLTRLVVFFALGLIFSGLLSFLRPLSSRLIGFMPYYIESQYVKFVGFSWHPNNYALFDIICLGSLLFLKYKNKISSLYFFLLFIPLFVFGFMTISRNFILSLGVALVLFVVFYIIKYKKNSLKFLSIGLALGVFVLVCFNLEFRIYLVRFNLASNEIIQEYIDNTQIDESVYPPKQEGPQSDYEYQSDEWWDAVYRGEILYDPGGEGIWDMYLTDFLSSPMTILFGRGIGSPFIGRMDAHNLFIQNLWNYGIIGYLLLLGVFVSFIDFKKLKGNILNLISLLILILPYYAMALFEATHFRLPFYMFLVLAYAGLFEENSKVEALNSTSLNVKKDKHVESLESTDTVKENLVEDKKL